MIIKNKNNPNPDINSNPNTILGDDYIEYKLKDNSTKDATTLLKLLYNTINSSHNGESTDNNDKA